MTFYDCEVGRYPSVRAALQRRVWALIRLRGGCAIEAFGKIRGDADPDALAVEAADVAKFLEGCTPEEEAALWLEVACAHLSVENPRRTDDAERGYRASGWSKVGAMSAFLGRPCSSDRYYDYLTSGWRKVRRRMQRANALEPLQVLPT